MVREIPLTRNLVALVDDEDYDLAASRKWHAVTYGRTTYAVNRNRDANGIKITRRLHCEVLRLLRGTRVDHIDHNGLNCQKRNLRIATPGQNMANQRVHVSGKVYSRFKGVTWDKAANRWLAQIQCNYRRKMLGRFDDERSAAQAYDKAAVALFGEFAFLNFPTTPESRP